MPWSLDARIPVHLGPVTPFAENDALLIEGDAAPASGAAERFVPSSTVHAPGCACCVSRGPAALALDRLFQRRARGEIAFFRRVIAVTTTLDGEFAVRAALSDDPVASARFRPDDQTGTS